jgi:thiosulfate/3-mercaptopyruvate sulfurtransferase
MTRSENGALYFLSKATYQARLSESGIESTAPSITYCSTGRYAAGPWFVVSEIIGNPSVKLYDGSLHLWTLEDRPLVMTAR